MSVTKGRRRAMHAALDFGAIYNRPWFITRSALESMSDAFLLGGRPHADWGDDDDDDNDPDKKPTPPYDLSADGLATLTIDAPLSQYGCWCGCRMAYGDLIVAHAHAVANPDVSGICMVFDSPGGEACSDWLAATDSIYNLRSQKPTVAISYDSCYSAAYCLASAANRVFVNRLAGVGSIGCWTAHFDYSEYLAKNGIKPTFVFAGAKKVDGNEMEPLSDRAKADMQDSVDRIRDQFVSSVARNRGVSADELYATEAGIYTAEKALPLLADQVGALEDARNWLRGQIAARQTVTPQAEPGNREQYGAEADTAAVNAGEIAAVAVELDAGFMAHLEVRSGGGGWSGRNAAVLALSNGFEAVRAEYPEAIAAIREVRAAASLDGDKIHLLVAPYNSTADLGEFDERYRPGCFDSSMQGDLRVLTNHAESRAYVLGRVTAGTARFWSDAQGVHAEAVPPDTTWANDLKVSMQRGDIRDASAAFYILKSSTETRADGRRTRWIEKGMLVDGSVEAFGAYPGAHSEVVAVEGQSATPILSTPTADRKEMQRQRARALRLR